MLVKKIVASLCVNFTDWFVTKYPDEFGKYFSEFKKEVEVQLQ